MSVGFNVYEGSGRAMINRLGVPNDLGIAIGADVLNTATKKVKKAKA